jgi:hypothetical protein
MMSALPPKADIAGRDLDVRYARAVVFDRTRSLGARWFIPRERYPDL